MLEEIKPEPAKSIYYFRGPLPKDEWWTEEHVNDESAVESASKSEKPVIRVIHSHAGRVVWTQ